MRCCENHAGHEDSDLLTSLPSISLCRTRELILVTFLRGKPWGRGCSVKPSGGILSPCILRWEPTLTTLPTEWWVSPSILLRMCVNLQCLCQNVNKMYILAVFEHVRYAIYSYVNRWQNDINAIFILRKCAVTGQSHVTPGNGMYRAQDSILCSLWCSRSGV